MDSSSTSLWMDTVRLPYNAPLSRDARADACVIGAGIAGLTTAYLLAKAGKSVIVIDALDIGRGETGRTTAHFFPPDERYFEIERRFGTDMAEKLADSYTCATDMVESIVRNEMIDCNFQRLNGYLVAPEKGDRKAKHVLGREYSAARKFQDGVQQMNRVPGLPFDTGPCVRFSNQAQFHPLKYLAGLARAIERMGGKIYGYTRAIHLEGDKDEQRVETQAGQHISAKNVVVATNTPFNDRVVMHTKQAGYRSYVVALEVPAGALPRFLLWDTGDPYYYVRLEKTAEDSPVEMLIVGGRDHKVGQGEHPEGRYDELEAWSRARFPMAGAVAYRWSGEVMEPSDGLPYLGRNPMDDQNVFIITGDSGNGMTHCTAGAMLVADQIFGRKNPWEELFSPSRKPFHGMSEFIKEQINTVAQYNDWFRGGEVESPHEIPAGEGAVVRDGARKLAVYREEDGGLHVLSAACTHLGCVVHFNSAEKSWDCPCHASRFDVHGEVLHGPAVLPLPPASLSPEEHPDVRPGGLPERRKVSRSSGAMGKRK